MINVSRDVFSSECWSYVALCSSVHANNIQYMQANVTQQSEHSVPTVCTENSNFALYNMQ